MANRTVASEDTWLQEQVSKFEKACVARSDQGHSSVCHYTDGLLAGFSGSSMQEKMLNVVQSFGFSSTDVDCKYQQLGPHVFGYVLVVKADWGSLRPAAGGEQKGPAQGGHIQICALCQEARPVVVLSPCGHVMCHTCEQQRPNRPQCPFCRQQVNSVTQGLFLN
ncbi:unnamed protein product [Symbiodinium sp. CCMP2456]|nr:unnamed protein product [Symbiodinium sp. CCMP2456]